MQAFSFMSLTTPSALLRDFLRDKTEGELGRRQFHAFMRLTDSAIAKRYEP